MNVLVTYLRDDIEGQSCIREGSGDDLGAAVRAADWLLPEGRWRRFGVSSKESILNDLKGRSRRSAERRFEGELVEVSGPRVVG